MITDPKTTVRSKTGQCIVAFSVALVEMLLRLDQVIYAPFYALFMVGPVALLIEMWLQSRGQKAVIVRRISDEPPTRETYKLRKKFEPMTLSTKLVACLVLTTAITGCKQKPSESQAVTPSSPARQIQPAPASPTAPGPVSAPTRPSGPIQFTDVTAQAGITLQAQQRRVREEVSAGDHGQRSLLSSTTTTTAGRTFSSSIPWIGLTISRISPIPRSTTTTTTAPSPM